MMRTHRHQRRGIAAVAMIIALIMINLMITALVLGGARDQNLTLRRLETVRSFYAAESGMNMSIREMMENSDEDGDGTIGSISDDANDANNPSINSATFYVTMSGAAPATLTSRGTSGTATRKLQAQTN